MGSIEFQSNVPSLLRVAANEDQFAEHRGFGVSQITFKVTPKESNGIFNIENTFHEKGGPPNTSTTIKMNGFMSLKVNSCLNLATDNSGE